MNDDKIRETMVTMTKGSKGIRDLSRRLVDDAEIVMVMKDVHLASDRTAAIVLASWVDQTLEQSLIGEFKRADLDTIRKMQENGGPLGSFYNKIYLGFALGLYEQTTLNNLESIRKIRNAFAHAAVQIDFSTKEIAAEVAKLDDQGRTSLEGMPETTSKERTKYTLCCVTFMVFIRFKKLGEKLEVFNKVMDALAPHITPLATLSAEHIENLRRAASTLKNVKP